MTRTDCFTLLPFLLIAGTPVVLILVIAATRNHALTAGFTVAGLVAALLSFWAVTPYTPRQVTQLLIIDRYAMFYTGVMIAGAIAVVLLAYPYFEKHRGHREEFYVLLLTAVLGCTVLVASSHLVSFFLGLEILSVSLYAMIGYSKNRRSLEAGIKYLVLAAASSSFLLFGMALIYADLGTMELARMADAASARSTPALLLPGIVLIITGIGFKLGVVPFHLWTPDVYDGAPAPVTAFIATVSKTATFAVLLRFLYHPGVQDSHTLFLVFVIISVASMIAGNVLALLQTNVKRILAYSSIAHFGYMLVAFLAGGNMAIEAVTFYLVAYTVTTLGAFGVVAVLSDSSRDADTLDDYRGLFWRRPVIAGIFTLMLLSLAGIPATMGFVGKFYVLAVGASAAKWSLLIILGMTSTIGLFYYLRILVVLYAGSFEAETSVQPLRPIGGFVLAVLAGVLVWFGIYPAPLQDMIQTNGVLSAAGLPAREPAMLSVRQGSRTTLRNELNQGTSIVPFLEPAK